MATLLLGAITVGEIRKGIEEVRERKRQADLERWLGDELLVRFRGQILPWDEEAAHLGPPAKSASTTCRTAWMTHW